MILSFVLGVIVASVYIKKGFKVLFFYIILPFLLIILFYGYHLATVPA